jgi:hypothetical protein
MHDGRGVTHCNKDQAVLHAIISTDGGKTYAPPPGFPLPLTGPASECQILKVDDLSTFYLQALVGQGVLHFRDPSITASNSPDVMLRSTGIKGFWPSNPGDDLRPRPEFLNRLVFFDVVNDGTHDGDPNRQTNLAIGDLSGPHIGSAAYPERVIPDPNVGDPDVAADGKVHGLRTCNDGDYLDQRDADTTFALEYSHGFDAITPLTAAFVNHKKENLLLDLFEVVYRHWNIANGVVNAEPALAQIASSDLFPSLVKLTQTMGPMAVTQCAATSKTTCDGGQQIPSVRVLAEALRSLIDPARAASAGVTDRSGATTIKAKPITVLALLRSALDAQDAVLGKDPARQKKWATARSHIVDELFAVKGRGDGAVFADPGVPHLIPAFINVLRSQRLAKCNGEAACTALRQQLAKDVDATLASPIVGASLDLVDVLLQDVAARQELGRMASFLTRQAGPWAGPQLSLDSTPFATTEGPGALDQAIAGLVDGLGALGDLRDIRPLYPVISHALDNLDPQLALLSRINARAYDNGHEVCSREVDPEEAIRDMLSRLALPVAPDGQPRRSALQIFMDAIADVNRVDASQTGPLVADDYGSVFNNVHDLLTDPTGGLEQLYASVRQATEH